MDTAFLRIKFTPLLLNDIHRGESKCCLEIVPEVSAIQNLDKVEWKADNSLVEYNIPMTYKIIIKKAQTIKDKDDELARVYHSCVDLLHTYSITNFDSSCGDVTRILSDNLFVSRITSECKCNIVTTEDSGINLKQICDKQQNTSSIHTIEINDVSILTHSSEMIIEQKRISIIEAAEEVTRPEYFDKRTEAYTNKKNIFDIIENDEGEASNDDDDFDNRTCLSPVSKNANYKSKLTLSPICSVNTCDNYSNATVNKKSNATSSTCTEHAFDFEHKIGIKSSSSPSYESKRNNIYTVLNRSVTESGDKELRRNTNRVLPDTRVAYFVQVMEKEIFPLKLLLNEIRVKCVSLGLFFSDEKAKHNVLLYKNVSSIEAQWTELRRNRKPNDARVRNVEKQLNCSYKGITNCCKCKQSNRVVYTIVFNESD